MVPGDTFADLEGDDLDAAVAAAELEAPLKTATLFLGLDPDDPDTQMLRASAGGPEGMRVIVIQSSLEDDSVRAIRWEFDIQIQAREDFAPVTTTTTIEGTTTSAASDETTTTVAEGPQDVIPVVFTAVRETQCQPGRGHQDFTAADCV
jgi:hypothetical protein